MTTDEQAYLRLTVEGSDDVDLKTFANSAQDLHTLLTRLTAREAAGQDAHWRIKTAPEFAVTASPNGVSATALVAVVADSYSAALVAADESSEPWPESFRRDDQVLMKRIVNRLRSDSPVHLDASRHQPVTLPAATRGRRGRALPIFAAWGTVDGELKVISSEAGLQIGLVEHGSAATVKCHISRDLLPKSFELFEETVRVHGYIYYRQNGRPSTITDVTLVERIPPAERALTDLLGTLPDLTDGLGPGEYIRRLRAGGNG